MKTLRKYWASQKFFYEKPDANDNINEYPAVTGQLKDDRIRLHSARDLAAVQNLYTWAKENNITTRVPGGFAGVQHQVDAPLHGHLADWSHTVKYARQKRPQGGGLVTIILTSQGSALLRQRRSQPGAIARGGEGNNPGGIGLKMENSFVSVALGETKQTWDFLKDKIARIEFD